MMLMTQLQSKHGVWTWGRYFYAMLANRKNRVSVINSTLPALDAGKRKHSTALIRQSRKSTPMNDFISHAPHPTIAARTIQPSSSPVIPSLDFEITIIYSLLGEPLRYRRMAPSHLKSSPSSHGMLTWHVNVLTKYRSTPRPSFWLHHPITSPNQVPVRQLALKIMTLKKGAVFEVDDVS